jgi:hypothetical protein
MAHSTLRSHFDRSFELLPVFIVQKLDAMFRWLFALLLLLFLAAR